MNWTHTTKKNLNSAGFILTVVSYLGRIKNVLVFRKAILARAMLADYDFPR